MLGIPDPPKPESALERAERVKSMVRTIEGFRALRTVITPDMLSRIKVLWRDPNLGLWGIPYAMRPGQSPSNL